MVKMICGAPAHALDAVRRRIYEACHMTESKDRRQVALPDPDPAIALALKAQEAFGREFLARRPTVEQLIERANQQRAEAIAAPVRRFAVRLKSLFRASAHPTTSVPFDA
jgi:hypothetical protein